MAYQIVITEAGRAEVINAENTGTGPVEITEIGVGTGAYTPDETQTALQNETKRLTTFAGANVGENIIHVTVRDETTDAYTISEFGLYTQSGTLFAVYSQATPILDKTAQSLLLMAVDIALTSVNAGSISFGSTEFIYPPATSTTKGVVRLQLNQTDSSAGAVLVPGAFGLGGTLVTDNADKATKGGMWSLPAALGAVNSPMVGRSGTIYVAQGGADVDYIHQTWTACNDDEEGRMFVRHFRPGTGWTFWTEIGKGNAVTITGPLLVYADSSNDYTITNYNSFSLYQVSSTVGAASVSGDVVTLNIPAGASPGEVRLTISRDDVDSVFVLAINANGVAQPTIEQPVDGATGIGETPKIYGSTFETFPNGFDAHASTDWQVATDSGFSNIIYQSLADTSNLEQITIPSGNLQVSTAYYVRFRYTATTIGTSDWSDYIQFTTNSEFVPTEAGTPYGGGYVAGVIDSGVERYALIVAPKASGESSSLKYKTTSTNDVGVDSYWDGQSNTANINDSSHPAAQFCSNLSVGGFSDWYLPARDELELLYRNLKPTTDNNNTGNRPQSGQYGENNNSDPIGIAYTSTNPAQTSLPEFQSGGSEVFYNLDYYWSSTQSAATSAWSQLPLDGTQFLAPKEQNRHARAVRKVPLN